MTLAHTEFQFGEFKCKGHARKNYSGSAYVPTYTFSVENVENVLPGMCACNKLLLSAALVDEHLATDDCRRNIVVLPLMGRPAFFLVECTAPLYDKMQGYSKVSD